VLVSRRNATAVLRTYDPPFATEPMPNHTSAAGRVRTLPNRVNGLVRQAPNRSRTCAEWQAVSAWDRNGASLSVGAGMQGDRASVVFATTDEISSFIKESCDAF
jgi:hypothetical protein